VESVVEGNFELEYLLLEGTSRFYCKIVLCALSCLCLSAQCRGIMFPIWLFVCLFVTKLVNKVIWKQMKSILLQIAQMVH